MHADMCQQHTSQSERTDKVRRWRLSQKSENQKRKKKYLRVEFARNLQ